MVSNQSKRKKTILKRMFIVLSILGLSVCIAVLFPQVRRMIMDFAEQMMETKLLSYHKWVKTLFSYAMGGIILILFFDYCTLTNSGKIFVERVKQEIKDCLSAIDFHSFIKQGLLLSGIYLLGMLTIILANDTYRDDILFCDAVF